MCEISTLPDVAEGGRHTCTYRGTIPFWDRVRNPKTRPQEQRQGSDDGVAHPGGDPFAEHDGGEDQKQDHRDLTPGEDIERRLQLEPDAARADQPENGAFADVD